MLSIYLVCLFAQDMYNVQIVRVIFQSHMMKIQNTITPFPPHLPEGFWNAYLWVLVNLHDV